VARIERLIDAPPERLFEILSQPRSYAYWVIGSRAIRDADEQWPAAGARLHHTVNIGPLRLRDHTKVEEVEPERFLQLKAKARPFGTARVKLELARADGGTRVTMVEDAANAVTAFVFSPLVHLLVRWRNVHSLERLAELAEGRVPLPGDEPEASVRTPGAGGAVVNPRLHGRRPVAASIGRGALAGLAGAAAMSVSTNAEMRLRGRPPSDAPMRAIERLLGVRARGRGGILLGAAGHVTASVGVGVARGALGAAGVGSRAAGAASLALALVPEVLVVPALGASDPPWRWSRSDVAIAVLHHGVFAAALQAAYGAR
jgi:uncharacterized protein YndB with AHSA1/START domain